jgi:hypothetical protein
MDRLFPATTETAMKATQTLFPGLNITLGLAVNPAWMPLATNTLTGGSAYFSDRQWTNYPARFFRIRSP